MLSYKDAGISVGVGVVDVVTELIDQKQGYTKPIYNITDALRLGVTVVGYAYAALGKGKMAELAGKVANDYTPLAIRTAYRIAKGAAPPGGMSFVQPNGITLVRAGQGYGATVPPPLAAPVSAPGRGYRSFVPG